MQKKKKRTSTWRTLSSAQTNSTLNNFSKSRRLKLSISRSQWKNTSVDRHYVRRSGVTSCKRINWTTRGPRHLRSSLKSSVKPIISYSLWLRSVLLRPIKPSLWHILNLAVKIRSRRLSFSRIKCISYMRKSASFKLIKTVCKLNSTRYKEWMWLSDAILSVTDSFYQMISSMEAIKTTTQQSNFSIRWKNSRIFSYSKGKLQMCLLS